MNAFVLAGVLVAGFVTAASAEAPHTAPIKNGKGDMLGTLALTGGPNGVLLHIEAKGLPPGWHGAHLHQKGSCDDAKFESAGGHVHDAAASKHGFMNADAMDAGDLPNVYVAADGGLMAEIYTDKVVLDGASGAKPVLHDADGSSLILHANPDDYTSQPIGGAGARVACAVVK